MSTDAAATGPRRTDRPLDEAGVVTAVRRAAERGTRVRPTGAGARAPGPLVRTDDVLLDASALTGVVEVADGTVRVRAGETIAALCTTLAASGRALATVPDAPRATIAGATGLGMYGGEPAVGSLSDQVLAVRLVDGLGRVREVTGPDLDAARCGLGALGVLTAVQLRTVPLRRLRVHEEATRTSDLLAGDVLTGHAWTECDVAVHTGQAIVRWAEPEDADDLPAESGEGRGGYAGTWGRAVSRLASSWWSSRSSWPPPHRWAPGTAGPPHEVLPDPQPWDPDLAEWAVPRAALGTVLRELGAAVAARGHELRPVRVRLGPAERGYLHPASGRETAYLRIRTRGAAEEPVRRLAGAVLEDAAGRPCWTTRHEWGPDELAVAYPGWAAFAEARDRFDPDRRFTDPYLASVLGR
ncbi:MULTISPECIES: D-arabinono-1,4-lactone oxidase [Pseudonocardia]|uniref:L-gulono-1,4-lactone dehydrogenase n=2 Tax=Pseudonocardia TaxID=1847 RepID=A0A1Y2MPL9_PSEAH|nr:MULTISPECIES: D-arabinono-1,4-lactone oxidase [Pseudonocardia]OSY37176.1 L-gulono-1,4-lactone dehydrogenase [Pseudonocardia autotrophica]TDN74797.1 L-gulonolactone oxidase [Pseudonocardia autotrophica]BBG05572.1 L-gulonolactone oxidase [Pseudonocardia autotrophica]GEC25823.1 L-gulonolactone oxidase [Pseudonocardia saturnea]